MCVAAHVPRLPQNRIAVTKNKRSKYAKYVKNLKFSNFHKNRYIVITNTENSPLGTWTNKTNTRVAKNRRIYIFLPSLILLNIRETESSSRTANIAHGWNTWTFPLDNFTNWMRTIMAKTSHTRVYSIFKLYSTFTTTLEHSATQL